MNQNNIYNILIDPETINMDTLITNNVQLLESIPNLPNDNTYISNLIMVNYCESSKYYILDLITQLVHNNKYILDNSFLTSILIPTICRSELQILKILSSNIDMSMFINDFLIEKILFYGRYEMILFFINLYKSHMKQLVFNNDFLTIKYDHNVVNDIWNNLQNINKPIINKNKINHKLTIHIFIKFCNNTIFEQINDPTNYDLTNYDLTNDSTHDHSQIYHIQFTTKQFISWFKSTNNAFPYCISKKELIDMYFNYTHKTIQNMQTIKKLINDDDIFWEILNLSYTKQQLINFMFGLK